MRLSSNRSWPTRPGITWLWATFTCTKASTVKNTRPWSTLAAWTLLLLYFVVIICMVTIDRQIVKKNQANIVYALALCIVLILPLVIYIARHPGVREVMPITEQTQLIAEAPPHPGPPGGPGRRGGHGHGRH